MPDTFISSSRNQYRQQLEHIPFRETVGGFSDRCGKNRLVIIIVIIVITGWQMNPETK